MAGKKSGAGYLGVGKKGKQDVTKGTDCGAHAALAATSSPASVKQAAQGSANYKHREN